MSRLISALGPSSPIRVVNLSGGIFQWANEERSLELEEGKGIGVHPYNGLYGKALRSTYSPLVHSRNEIDPILANYTGDLWRGE